MNKVAIILSVFVFGTLFAGLASAQCGISISASDTQGFLNEVSSLNSQLQNCPQSLPFPLSSLFGNQNVLFSISMQDGTTQEVVFTTSGGALSGVSTSASGSGYKISITECGFDTALREDDFAVYGQLWKSKDLKISASGFFKKMLLSALKPFIGGALGTPATPYTISCSSGAVTPSNAGIPSGKPEYCDETYLAGHQGYAQNQELWDSYSADTDNVCQSQYGRGIPSPCVHSVQLSVSGNPYYLCWYNE